MERTEFTKDDSLIIKGLAILAIMLHNFFRWVEPTTGENEFGFSANCISNFANLIASEPQEFINIIFSYLGHFGVQLFILISGYGLTKSMLGKPQCWTAFMGNRLKKLYPLLLVAIAAFFAFNLAFGYDVPDHFERETAYKLLLIHTLHPYSGLTMCGPWWFFGLIVQLYILFPVLLSLTQRHGTKILAIAAAISYMWILLALFFYDHDAGSLMAMQNAPGHLPEFCFGIWLALRRDTCLNRWWLLPALAAFVLGNFFKAFCPFTFLAVSVIFVIGYNHAKSFIVRHSTLERTLIFVGSISMFLFAVHGFIRQPFIEFAESHGNAAISLLTALVYLAATIAFSMIIKPLYKLLIWLLNKIRIPEIVFKADKFLMAATLLLLATISAFHATSLIQKHLEFDKNILTEQYSFKTENTIESDTLYSDILHIRFKRSGLIKITIDAEIDTETVDNDSIPLLVTEIENLFWDNFIMPQTEGFQSVHFEKNIYCSFFDHRKTKYLKLYFWNRRKSAMQFRNAKVKIDYQKW